MTEDLMESGRSKLTNSLNVQFESQKKKRTTSIGDHQGNNTYDFDEDTIEVTEGTHQSMVISRNTTTGVGIFDEMLSLNQQKKLLKYQNDTRFTMSDTE